MLPPLHHSRQLAPPSPAPYQGMRTDSRGPRTSSLGPLKSPPSLSGYESASAYGNAQFITAPEENKSNIARVVDRAIGRTDFIHGSDALSQAAEKKLLPKNLQYTIEASSALKLAEKNLADSKSF